MARNISVAEFEAVPRPVLAVGNDYPAGYEITPHRHRRGQLLHAVEGVMLVTTDAGTLLVPPDRAVWIPPWLTHAMRSTGAPLAVRNLFVEPGAIDGLPAESRVVRITPLMRALILEAVDLPLEYEESGRPAAVMSLLLHELVALPVLPLGLPMPVSGPLADLCHRFAEAPDPHATIDDWCRRLNMSRRSFTRNFRAETGLSFAQWRQRACLFAALPRLGAGEAVTSVALDLGYESVAAFTTMFRRLLGEAPSRYFQSPA
ncbi:helix-turn-helix transcriptional regulator [Zavarzinia compransoris]|uniref:AraC family transcriptional regulator n=1 Tax=Zavarzinia marina TaxID=2911065 RepID=UPI001F44E792|nr:helix-turn-helix transcriptional regulator [Zavarzinia marina]MCF4167236.1 helix-turn-helix transcriptional regulator [Zavarzinia marina]